MQSFVLIRHFWDIFFAIFVCISKVTIRTDLRGTLFQFVKFFRVSDINCLLHIWKKEVLKKFSAWSDFPKRTLEPGYGSTNQFFVIFSTFYFCKILNNFRVFQHFPTIFILWTYEYKLKTNSWKFSGKLKILEIFLKMRNKNKMRKRGKLRQLPFDRAENFMKMVGQKNMRRMLRFWDIAKNWFLYG
jgi:hypothetical protein